MDNVSACSTSKASERAGYAPPGSALFPVSPESFRAALSHFASGITIVTTRSQARNYGATVSAFCSLSVDPPLILVCLNKDSRCHAAITEAAVFGVNFLNRDDEKLSRQFASQVHDKFANVEYTYGITSVPILCSASVSLECQLSEAVSGGDHSIFIGTVVQAIIRDYRGALVYHCRAYHQIG